MENKYYAIYWDFGKWNRMHPNGMNLDAANAFIKESKQTREVIHEMWLDCLNDWPEPGFFDNI